MQTSDLNALLPGASKPGPVIKYGTVSQVSPLKVIIDGDTTATDVNSACTPIVGQRVVMVLQDRILTAVAALDVDTGWLTTGHSVSSGWSVSTIRYRRVGKMVYVYVGFDRTGADINGGATGNIANVAVVTLPAGFRPSVSCALNSGEGGWMVAGFISATGVIYLSAVPPNQVVSSTGSGLSLGGMFPID